MKERITMSLIEEISDGKEKQILKFADSLWELRSRIKKDVCDYNLLHRVRSIRNGIITTDSKKGHFFLEINLNTKKIIITENVDIEDYEAVARSRNNKKEYSINNLMDIYYEEID